jgi:ribulose-5-phosphate 4-epimerase/fuculose-1-phosphate aldolase
MMHPEVCKPMQTSKPEYSLIEITGFSERFIHSEIYKAYPSVQTVVHSHSLAVIPFSISSQPLSACFHMAGFLGCKVPVWDIDTAYAESDQRDMLVRNSKLGASLAKSLGEGSDLKHAVALMRGHGMVVVAENIEMVVFKCIYTAQNAAIQQNAHALGGSIQLFSQKEVDDTANTTAKGAVKPWPLWVREVEDASLYRNLV